MIALCAGLACAGSVVRQEPRAEFWAFTGPWDPRSAASAVSHGAKIDVLVSGWIGLDTATGAPFLRYPDSLVGRRGGGRSMAIVTSEQDEQFRPELVRELARDSAKLAAASSWIAGTLAARRYRGVVLDFENHPPDDLAALIKVAKSIADSVHAHGVREVAMAIPAGDTAAYPAHPLLAAVDLVVVMLYDQHWSRSAPGPIADPAWVRQWLSVRVGEAGADRVVAALPLYGYQWTPGSANAAATVGYDDARRLGVQRSVSLRRDSASATLHASSAGQWEIWVADAGLLERLATVARGLGVRRVALWRLGLEDPAVWTDVVRQ